MSIVPVERGTIPEGENEMTVIDELIALVDNLDDTGHDYRDVRAIKRIAHNLAKIAENLESAA